MKKRSGFTLVELMVTVTVAAILLMVGVPSFISIIRSNNTVAQANHLVTSLNLARSEAIKRGMQVTVGRTGAEWEDGWRIFTDQNGDGVVDAGDTVLKVYGALKEGFTLRTGGNFADWVGYVSTGVSEGSGPGDNDTFHLCADNQVAAQGRSIVVSGTGRIRMEIGTDSCQ